MRRAWGSTWDDSLRWSRHSFRLTPTTKTQCSALSSSSKNSAHSPLPELSHDDYTHAVCAGCRDEAPDGFEQRTSSLAMEVEAFGGKSEGSRCPPCFS